MKPELVFAVCRCLANLTNVMVRRRLSNILNRFSISFVEEKKDRPPVRPLSQYTYSYKIDVFIFKMKFEHAW